MINPKSFTHLYNSQQLKAMYPTQSVGALSSHVQSQINENTKADKVSISPAAKLALEKAQGQNHNNPRYQAILEKAQKANAANNPQGFLASLSQSEYQFLNKMHNMAIIDNPKNLSYEGALNLILPSHLQQDINDDGIVGVGKANILKFPPPNAPDNVKKAFSDVTKNMSTEERMSLEAAFLPYMLMANVRADGTFAEPGDKDFKNPFAKERFSYMNSVKFMLENIEVFKKSNSEEVYQRRLSGLNKLIESYQKHEVK